MFDTMADRGCLVIDAYGAYAGLFLAPPDYQQGDAFRIIYVHVPSAYLSMMAYMFMAISGAIGLIWRLKLAHCRGCRSCTAGRSLYFSRTGHRFDLGAADVGNLVGVG